MTSSNSRKKRISPKQSSLAQTQASPYPFSAIVGQEEMKLALILNTIDPLIGGVLIMGHRGTGKSTAVRAIADLLPEIECVTNCIYHCDPLNPQCHDCKTKSVSRLKKKLEKTPVVELPLGATEDRVCGTISIERALKDGTKAFEPGLLAQSNRGFFYIDEVNLLEDHLVDLLLDVAATGWNKVEREGISIEHPAHFVLVGSGNPEEGDLRPQLLDRFGLNVAVSTENDVESRMQVIQRRDSYDRDPLAFRLLFAKHQDKLQQRIIEARNGFAQVEVEDSLLRLIAELCIDLKIDGHRGELTIMRAARAFAAFEGRQGVEANDVRRVAMMALRHRLRRTPLEDTDSSDRIERALEQKLSEAAVDITTENIEHDSHVNNKSPRKTQSPLPPMVENASSLTVEIDPTRSKGTSKTGRRPTGSKRKVMNAERGRHARSTSLKPAHARIALAATLQTMLVANSRDPAHIRYKQFSRKKGTLFILAIDSSGSMGENRIAVAKRVMMDRLQQSYVNRDMVSIICFRGESAELSLPPTRSILRARHVINSLRVGGPTPLSGGLACTLDLIKCVGDSLGEIVVLLFTDGRGNVSLSRSTGESRTSLITEEIKQLADSIRRTKATTVVVDTKHEFESSSETKHLAKLLQGKWIRIKRDGAVSGRSISDE